MRVVLPGKSSSLWFTQSHPSPSVPIPSGPLSPGIVTMPLLHIIPPRLHTHSGFFSLLAPLFVPSSHCNWCMQSLFTRAMWYFNFLPQKISCAAKNCYKYGCYIHQTWVRTLTESLFALGEINFPSFLCPFPNVFPVRDVLMFSNTKEAPLLF